MDVIALLSEVHRENFGERGDLEASLRGLLESYDLQSDGDVPAWFVSLLSAIGSVPLNVRN